MNKVGRHLSLVGRRGHHLSDQPVIVEVRRVEVAFFQALADLFLASGAGLGGGDGEVLRVLGAEGLPRLFQAIRRNRLTDYGVVHGTEPENAWLVPGQNYTVETVPPQAPLRIQLAHAAKFSGGRGWRAVPITRNILVQLGLPTPQHLTRQNAVTLRAVVI
jgi:hypothetical protein